MIDPAIPLVMKDNRTTRIWIARGVAVVADLLQLPLFFAGGAAGGINPLEDVLDVVVAGILTILVGWHIAFLPSFIVKVVPFADLAPTWTLAVLIATRGGGKPTAPADAMADSPLSGDR